MSMNLAPVYEYTTECFSIAAEDVVDVAGVLLGEVYAQGIADAIVAYVTMQVRERHPAQGRIGDTGYLDRLKDVLLNRAAEGCGELRGEEK